MFSGYLIFSLNYDWELLVGISKKKFFIAELFIKSQKGSMDKFGIWENAK